MTSPPTGNGRRAPQPLSCANPVGVSGRQRGGAGVISVGVAGKRSAAQERDFLEEVTLGRYLAEHRALPHLFPLDPAAAGDDAEDMVSALASMVRARGDRETDVCLLADDGERHLGLAQGLADLLRCDVYLTPGGGIVRYLHIRTPANGDLWEAMALDAASGQPVDWLVVRPVGLPSSAATWFTSERGLLRRRRAGPP